jgi:hypothetical protein
MYNFPVFTAPDAAHFVRQTVGLLSWLVTQGIPAERLTAEATAAGKVVETMPLGLAPQVRRDVHERVERLTTSGEFEAANALSQLAEIILGQAA